MHQRLVPRSKVRAQIVKHGFQQTGLVHSQIAHKVTPIALHVEQAGHVTIAACLLPVDQVELKIISTFGS
jgi:hypothetical protein